MRSIGIIILSLLVFAFGIWIYFFNLGTGTPTWQKNLQIFRNREEVEKWAPVMNELRTKHYSTLNEMLNPQKSEKSFKENYEKLFGQKDVSFSQLTQDHVLDRIRGYLIGVRNSDEQNTMMALSRLNPIRLKFNPGVDTFYGGFYYYTCGGVLFGGKLLHLVSLKPDVMFYFSHPEETMWMYWLIRFVGAASAILTLALIFVWLSRLFNLQTALLAGLFFIFSPLLVPYAHMAKAHNYAMFLFFLGFYCIWKTVERPELKYYLLGGLVLGCSAGSIITNLTVGIVIFLIEWARNDWNLIATLRNKNFWLASILFFLVYLVTNFYIFVEFAKFQRTLMALKQYMRGYGESYGDVELNNWLPFLKDMFTNQLHWSIIPLLLIGIFSSFKSGSKFLQVSSAAFLILTLFNLLLTRHPGINLRVFPLIAILCAQGFFEIWNRRLISYRTVAALFLVVALFFSAMQTIFYASLFKEPTHLELAGDWMNQNIVPGTSIGVLGGEFAQSSFPAIHFLDYKMIHFPAVKENVSFSKKQLPAYVASLLEHHPVIDSNYILIQSWKTPRTFCGIPFQSRWVLSGNADFFIFKKIS